MNKVLYVMAPVKQFQTRTRHAPWMSEETKLLKKKREEAHQKLVRQTFQRTGENLEDLGTR